MKIILVHHQNSDNIRSFSGTSYFMSKAIKDEFEEVLDYNSFESAETYRQVHEQGIKPVLQPIGARLSSFLRSNKIKADYLICQGGNSCIPYYNYNIPVVFWHDSTWHTILHGYASPQHFKEFRSSCRNFYLWDKAALNNTDILIYSSQFIADACIVNYKTLRQKVKVIPFGANIHSAPSQLFLEAALQERLTSGLLQLTFIGKDWKRKGLHEAFLLAETLNAQGIPAMLNIVGCHPDIPALNGSPFVHLWGFLDKSNSADLQTLNNILKKTHFLVHPAVSEPFGISLCEANAYGIPIIGTAVEGLKTIVTNGINGYLLDSKEWLTKGVGIIKEIVAGLDTRYPPVFHSSLKEYARKLNWQSNVLELKRALIDFKRN